MRKKKPKKFTYFDYNLLAIIIFLTCFGLVMLYSTSSYTAQINYKGNSFFFFTRQAIISAASFVVMMVISLIDYRIWEKLAWLAYIGGIAMILLLLSPMGKGTKGATRWLKIVGETWTIQPAEFAKLSTILFVAFLICKIGKNMARKTGVMIVFLSGLIMFGLIYYISNNLSTAIIVLGITCIMIYISHPKTWPFLVLAGLAASAVSVGVYYMYTHIEDIASSGFRLQRVLAWLRPEEYASGKGYQVLQGLYAIGSGGFFGKGLGNSTQKLGWIPEAQNDMIFSVICEELGLCGAIMVTVLFGIMLYRLLFIARNAPTLFGSLIVCGIFAHIALQVIFNIAVVINLIPTTGITLPFISYGGTSILFLMSEMGVALGVSRKITFENE